MYVLYYIKYIIIPIIIPVKLNDSMIDCHNKGEDDKRLHAFKARALPAQDRGQRPQRSKFNAAIGLHQREPYTNEASTSFTDALVKLSQLG